MMDTTEVPSALQHRWSRSHLQHPEPNYRGRSRIVELGHTESSVQYDRTLHQYSIKNVKIRYRASLQKPMSFFCLYRNIWPMKLFPILKNTTPRRIHRLPVCVQTPNVCEEYPKHRRRALEEMMPEPSSRKHVSRSSRSSQA